MEISSSLLPSDFMTSARRVWLNRHFLSFAQSSQILKILGYGFVNSALALVQRMIIPLPDQELPAPVFVIGHWRSGTTLLHELLCLDERHGFPSNHACMNPHHFLISGKGMRMMPAGAVKYQRPMDEMVVGIDSPQEDEFALLALGAPSPYEAFMFPHAMMDFRGSCDISSLPKPEQDRWCDIFTGFLRLVALENKGRRLVLKSPTHTFRINKLLELFPQAAFVHIVRNPYAVFASTLRMLRSMFSLYALTPVDDAVLEEFVIANGTLMEACLERDLPGLGPSCFAQLRHEDLVRDPVREGEAIYRKLGLGDPAQVLKRVSGYFQERSGYRASRNPLDERQTALVSSAWSGMFQKYGYERLTA